METGASPLRPGYRLDRYELLCPIASGGMAQVWLAQLRGKRGFEKLFAIKTIKTDLTDDAAFQEMFLDEARIASGIQHPNVAQILDLGEQDEVLYIVMEWVDGESLSRILKLARKRKLALPTGVALRIVADACEGIHAAHELRDAQGNALGVVHRDISPQNLLVSAAGSVKVIDFGIAKATNRHALDTRDGVVKGKVRYMAPEQVNGKDTDRRADVWAMGVCLYELVTGELPFDGDNDVQVVRRLMSGEAPPRPAGAVPEAIELVLARSLVRMPDARFASAAAMHRALEEAIDDVDVATTNEDVAEFVRRAVPELERQRRATVTTALAEAKARGEGQGRDGRGRSSSSESAAASLEDALAPTVVADSTPLALGPPRRHSRPPPPTREESRPTLRASELVGARNARGGGVVWGALLILLGALGAGAWFVWPGKAWVRTAVGSPPPQPIPEPASAPPPTPSAVDSTPPPPPSAAAPDPSGLAALDATDAGVDAAAPAPQHFTGGLPHHLLGAPSAVPRSSGPAWGLLPVPEVPRVPRTSASGAPDDTNPF